MIVVQEIKKDAEGNYVTAWKLNHEQMSYLLTFAINTLIQEGLVQIETQGGQMELDFLKEVPTSTLGSKQ